MRILSLGTIISFCATLARCWWSRQGRDSVFEKFPRLWLVALLCKLADHLLQGWLGVAWLAGKSIKRFSPKGSAIFPRVCVTCLSLGELTFPPNAFTNTLSLLTTITTTFTTMAQAAPATPQPPRPHPNTPPSQSSSTWSGLDQDALHGGAAGAGNQGLWSLLAAASKYEEFEELDDDDSMESVCYHFI